MQHFTKSPNRDREGASCRVRRLCGRSLTVAVRICLLWAFFCPGVFAQVDRQTYLENEPLAAVDVQSLAPSKEKAYTSPNALLMYQREEEDPLSYYVRTQDGEWLIPTQVNPDDSWVRVLILGPGKPTVVDLAIEINNRAFRAAREQWIDQLLAEAHKTFLIRTGVEAAESAEKGEAAEEGEADEPEVTVEGASPEDTSSETEPSEGTDKNSEPEIPQPEIPLPEIPMVEAQGRKTSTLFKRLINYLAADQSIAEHEASREELRWLLAEWTGGPALLTLGPAMAWRRADTAPLWQALDRNDDNRLSSDEIQQAMKTFQLADINQDDIVDLSELKRLGKGHAQHERTKGYPLLIVIDENTDWKALKKDLISAYGSHSDQALRSEDATGFLTISPDMVYRISFGSDLNTEEKGRQEAKVTLLAIQGDESSGWRLRSSTAEVISVEGTETFMEMTAAQGDVDAENASGDMQQTQVSIGAVVDGFPLFRLFDHDNNHQLTLRERREVSDVLTAFDRNQDGQVDHSEIPTAIRLSVTHGAKVHTHLASAVAAQQRDDSDRMDAEAPAWFVGMDRNHDGDLSRREFQGSPKQFAKYDRDHDSLISRNEAQNPTQNPTQNTEAKN